MPLAAVPLRWAVASGRRTYPAPRLSRAADDRPWVGRVAREVRTTTGVADRGAQALLSEIAEPEAQRSGIAASKRQAVMMMRGPGVAYLEPGACGSLS